MRLLIITQKVDKSDSLLGFFHRWIEEFAVHSEVVHVVCLFEGEYTLPHNVFVHSLGKERKPSRWNYIKMFYTYIWKFRHEYDAVFVHMNPEYIVLGGLFWRIFKKRIALWYTHKAVNLKLRVATLFSNVVFSASQKSFNLPTQKLKVVGHGIDMELFSCRKKTVPGHSLQVLHMGRISEIKDGKTFVRVIGILKKQLNMSVQGIFAGDAETDKDKTYLSELKVLVDELGLAGNIVFAGNPRFSDVPQFFFDADLVLNLAPTGGVDKAALSAIATCRPIVVSNAAFASIFDKYSERLIATHGEPEDFAKKAVSILIAKDKDELVANLRTRIETDYSVQQLIRSVLKEI
jgi:glycosyltransferase involved in cell wall biosynthesis